MAVDAAPSGVDAMTFDHEQETAPSQAWRTAPGPLYPLALGGQRTVQYIKMCAAGCLN